MLKKIYFILTLLIIILTFACDKKKETIVNKSIFETEYPASSKDNFVILNFTSDISGIDPITSNDPDYGTIALALHDSLMSFDYDGNIIPGLAVSWKMLNKTTYQFKLRKGVQFHNGKEFDAYDVKYTFDTHLDPKNNSAHGKILNTNEIISINKVVVIDNYTVNFELNRESGVFLNLMCLFGVIIPKGYPLNQLKKHPIGTGPYKFVKYVKGDKIVLTRNEHYWKKGYPKIKNLIFKIIPAEKWGQAIVSGQVDFIMHLSGDHRTIIEADAHTDIMERLTLSSVRITLRNRGPLRDVKVRKALNYAVNKKRLIRYAEYGKGKVSASFGKEGELGYNENLQPYEYNIAKAKALMKEAGYEKGFKLKAFTVDLCENVMKLIQNDLKDIHVDLELEIGSTMDYITRAPLKSKETGRKTPDCHMVAWIIDSPIYNMLFNATTMMVSSFSYLKNSKYDYPEYEARHIWANVSDPLEHNRRLKQLDKFIYDNAYFIFTYQRVLTSAIRKNVHMKKLNLNGHLENLMLSETTKDE